MSTSKSELIALASGMSLQWMPSDSFWSKVEAAYGVPFIPELRRKIEAVTNMYSMFAPLFTMPSKKRVEDQLTALITSGNEVVRMFYGHGETINRIANDDEIPRLVQAVPGYKVDELGRFVIALSSALVKADKIRGNLDKLSRRDVMPWEAWVSWLSQVLKDHKLPVGASNGSDKSSATSSTSKFVQFIALIEHEIWRGNFPWQSDWALAKAINRARKPHPSTLDWDTSIEYWEQKSRFITRLRRLQSLKEVETGQKS